MANTAEKMPEADQEQKTIEQWLREDVVRIYDARKADPSRGKPLEQALEDTKARLKAKHGA